MEKKPGGRVGTLREPSGETAALLGSTGDRRMVFMVRVWNHAAAGVEVRGRARVSQPGRSSNGEGDSDWKPGFGPEFQCETGLPFSTAMVRFFP